MLCKIIPFFRINFHAYLAYFVEKLNTGSKLCQHIALNVVFVATNVKLFAYHFSLLPELQHSTQFERVAIV